MKYQMLRLNRLRGMLLTALSILTFYFVFFSRLPTPRVLSHTLTSRLATTSSTHYDLNVGAPTTQHQRLASAPRFGIVSMVYGTPNQNYQRALEAHQQYAARHNYEAYILRKELVDGVWNKLAYLLYVVFAELQRDENERAHWLMWVDADSIIINSVLPLDIFLPPEDFSYVHVLGSRDQNGLNAGMLFIRVHEWSVQMLTRALSLPRHYPELFDPTEGRKLNEQDALVYVFNESGWKDSVLYQPRIWWNAYQWSHAYEGGQRPGNMYVHFAGLEPDVRSQTMQEWLKIIRGPERQKWELPVERTNYPEDIAKFWSTLRSARLTLDSTAPVLAEGMAEPQALKDAKDRLILALWNETDQLDTLRAATEAVQVKLDGLKSQPVQEM